MNTPEEIDGAQVEVLDPDNVLEFNGERWVTLLPVDESDERLWEFSLTTGRIIQTV